MNSSSIGLTEFSVLRIHEFASRLDILVLIFCVIKLGWVSFCCEKLEDSKDTHHYNWPSEHTQKVVMKKCAGK